MVGVSEQHREIIAAFDFFTVPTLNFRTLYCFFVIEHGRRRILHFNCTEHPTGNWIVPTLYYQSYVDKPPLVYWLVAASFKWFGTQVWAARLVPASAAFLTVVATYIFGIRTIGTRAAFLAAMVLALVLLPALATVTAGDGSPWPACMRTGTSRQDNKMNATRPPLRSLHSPRAFARDGRLTSTYLFLQRS